MLNDEKKKIAESLYLELGYQNKELRITRLEDAKAELFELNENQKGIGGILIADDGSYLICGSAYSLSYYIEEFKKKNKIPLIVILDNVRSLNNVGSVFRTSDAFLVKAVYLCGITATPPHPEIHKTALGAEDSVEWHYFEDTNAAVDKLHEEGYIVYAIEQVENSIILSDLQLNKDCKYAVVLGNEVKGVQQSVVDKCDQSIEIPQFGTKHSLNVSVTAGLVIWDFFKMLR